MHANTEQKSYYSAHAITSSAKELFNKLQALSFESWAASYPGENLFPIGQLLATLVLFVLWCNCWAGCLQNCFGYKEKFDVYFGVG